MPEQPDTKSPFFVFSQRLAILPLTLETLIAPCFSTAIPAESDDGDSYNIQKLYYIPNVYRLSTVQGPTYTMYDGEKFSDPFYLVLANYEDDKFFSFNTVSQYVMNEGENSFTKTNVVINPKDGGYYTVNFTPTASCKIYFETPNGDKSDVITLEN